MWISILFFAARMAMMPFISEQHRVKLDCDGPCVGESVTIQNPVLNKYFAVLHCGGEKDYVDLDITLEPKSRVIYEVELIGPDPGPEPVCRLKSLWPDPRGN